MARFNRNIITADDVAKVRAGNPLPALADTPPAGILDAPPAPIASTRRSSTCSVKTAPANAGVDIAAHVQPETGRRPRKQRVTQVTALTETPPIPGAARAELASQYEKEPTGVTTFELMLDDFVEGSTGRSGRGHRLRDVEESSGNSKPLLFCAHVVPPHTR
jgi:hypothetical protein